MKFRITLVSIMFPLLFGSIAFGQDRGYCGVTDPMPLLERVTAHLNTLESQPIQPRSSITKYVPVTFILVALNDGTQRAREEQVLEQLAALNADFAPQDMIYYLDEWRYKNNSEIFDDQSTPAARFQMRLSEDPNALNVFVVRTCVSGNSDLPPGAQINGYYNPSEDWLVMRKDNLNGFNNTLAHEAGHFWSLPHPHSGWECEPYDEEVHGNPVNIVWSPCNGSLRIELMNGSNCTIAGDRICDTNPDYNFGYGWSSGGDQCAEYTPQIMDSNGDLIDVIENNMMGYFANCDGYIFTPTQQSLIQTDYYSAPRAYLRTGYTPDLDTVENTIVYNYPINGEETATFDNVDLDWEDEPGATDYLVIVDRSASFTFVPQRFIVQESFLTIPELTPNVNYFWKVWPFNESQTGAGWAATQTFHTGLSSGVQTISSVDRLEVYPNPVEAQNEITIIVESSKAFDAEISLLDVTGEMAWYQSAQHIEAGRETRISVTTEHLVPGLYFLKIQSSEGGVISKKVSIL